ncbi:MAG: secretin N-terminal domain-containing protein [Fidelibacterota bacterium]
MNKTILFLAIFISGFLFSQGDTQGSEGISDPEVTIHAEDTHLPTVLAILAEESGFNIVTGPMVDKEAKLTIHLDSVPVSQAINLIVRAVGLSYEIIGNSILVAKSDQLIKEVGINSFVVPLKYANADEVQSLLVDITEQVKVDKSGNNLLINTSPKKITEIENIISKIDVPALQIMLQARLIEVAVSDEQKFGVDWSKLAKISTILAESGNPVTLNGVETGSLIPGTSFSQGANGGIDESLTAMPYGQLPAQMYYQRMDPDNKLKFNRQLTAYDVTLDFLLKNNKATVLANSQVVALNGREAYIEMVDVVPYILSAGGVGGQVQVQREEVGIKLGILPIVNSDGFITTTVTPEVSSIWDFIGPDNNIPWIKRRKSTTTIRVEDQETIIIAGLLGADKKYEQHRFPLLWRIPYIGEKLFTHTTENESKTDLIIEITPHIVRDSYTGIESKNWHKDAVDTMIPTDSLDTQESPTNK